jgi:hypothetical protein
LRSLCYVSRNLISIPDQSSEIDKLVFVARSRNSCLDITGALIATHEFFAQILEGPGVAITELMDSIQRDARHTGITIVMDEAVSDRRFPKWSLAYTGRSHQKTALVTPLLTAERDDLTGHTLRLIQHMQEFSVG